ncbi:hypothetical protein Hypma_000020, partial [Hypsizygus marmoreus]
LDISADKSLLEQIVVGYLEDDFAKQLRKDIAAGSIEGAHEEHNLIYVGRRLLIPQIPRIQELFYNLAHDTLGHFGFHKSYAALRDSYYWPNMRRDLEQAYIPSCSQCQRNKDRTSKPTGPLHPLPVPDARFDTVALDFVGPLPEEEGKDTILTMTDTLRTEVRLAAAQDNLLAAKIRQAYHANEHRAAEVVYKEGELVMLSTENRRRNYKRKGKKRVAKFMPRNDGPYTIVKAFPERSEYTLRLPNNPKTFPGFHSSLLKRFLPNDPSLFPDREFTRPGAIVTEDGTEENMIDKIVDARRRGRGRQYLVQWVGYDRDHDEWLSGREVEDTEALDIWEAENGTDV